MFRVNSKTTTIVVPTYILPILGAPLILAALNSLCRLKSKKPSDDIIDFDSKKECSNHSETTSPASSSSLPPTDAEIVPYPCGEAADFEAWGKALLAWLTTYRTKCKSLPVISRVEPNYLRNALPTSAPEKPEHWSSIMSDLDSKILPGLTHWEASNKFFAYFKPHSSYPAVLGELVCAGLNVMGFDWIASPCCTELEVVTMDWLAKFLNLPSQFLHSAEGPGGGVIQGSAGESATVVLLAAITKAKKKFPKLTREKMVVYCSDQTHAIVQKATMILGIHFRSIPTSKETNYALNPDRLGANLRRSKKDGLIPIAVIATTGTTSSCAFGVLS